MTLNRENLELHLTGGDRKVYESNLNESNITSELAQREILLPQLRCSFHPQNNCCRRQNDVVRNIFFEFS